MSASNINSVLVPSDNYFIKESILSLEESLHTIRIGVSNLPLPLWETKFKLVKRTNSSFLGNVTKNSNLYYEIIKTLDDLESKINHISYNDNSAYTVSKEFVSKLDWIFSSINEYVRTRKLLASSIRKNIEKPVRVRSYRVNRYRSHRYRSHRWSWKAFFMILLGGGCLTAMLILRANYVRFDPDVSNWASVVAVIGGIIGIFGGIGGLIAGGIVGAIAGALLALLLKLLINTIFGIIILTAIALFLGWLIGFVIEK